MSDAEIKEIRSDLTIVGGDIVHSNDGDERKWLRCGLFKRAPLLPGSSLSQRGAVHARIAPQTYVKAKKQARAIQRCTAAWIASLRSQ